MSKKKRRNRLDKHAYAIPRARPRRGRLCRSVLSLDCARRCGAGPCGDCLGCMDQFETAVASAVASVTAPAMTNRPRARRSLARRPAPNATPAKRRSGKDRNTRTRCNMRPKRLCSAISAMRNSTTTASSRHFSAATEGFHRPPMAPSSSWPTSKSATRWGCIHCRRPSGRVSGRARRRCRSPGIHGRKRRRRRALKCHLYPDEHVTSTDQLHWTGLNHELELDVRRLRNIRPNSVQQTTEAANNTYATE